MTVIKTDELVAILGARGKGKSTLFKKLILNFPRYIIWDHMLEHGKLGFLCDTEEKLKHAVDQQYPYIVYQPFKKSEEEFEAVNDMVLYECPNYMYAIEEADKFIRSKHVPEKCNELIQRGRHSGIGMMFLSRRIFRLNPDAIENCDHIFCFNVHLPRDLDYLKKIHPDFEHAQNLKQYEFLHYIRGEKVVKHKPLKLKKKRK